MGGAVEGRFPSSLSNQSTTAPAGQEERVAGCRPWNLLLSASEAFMLGAQALSICLKLDSVLCPATQPPESPEIICLTLFARIACR